MISLDHPAPHLPIRGLSFPDKKIVGDGQFPDFGMPQADRFIIHLRRLSAASPEDIRSAVQQRCLPMANHRRRYAVFGRQLRHRALALYWAQAPRGLWTPRHGCCVSALLIASFLENSKRQIAASVTRRFQGGGSVGLANCPIVAYFAGHERR
ncbi:hypothetical protein [Paracoccus aminovorans]|uniref:hypothetical protein n=1 Tax=Paracoccus aminovorans TaxID=34004 RepID=UPI002B2569CC|nr:hypothetical protein [Paracoccus aminovorans]